MQAPPSFSSSASCWMLSPLPQSLLEIWVLDIAVLNPDSPADGRMKAMSSINALKIPIECLIPCQSRSDRIFLRELPRFLFLGINFYLVPRSFARLLIFIGYCRSGGKKSKNCRLSSNVWSTKRSRDKPKAMLSGSFHQSSVFRSTEVYQSQQMNNL